MPLSRRSLLSFFAAAPLLPLAAVPLLPRPAQTLNQFSVGRTLSATVMNGEFDTSAMRFKATMRVVGFNARLNDDFARTLAEIEAMRHPQDGVMLMSILHP